MESPAVPVRPPPEAPRRIPAEPVGPPPSRLLRPRTPPKTPPPSSPSSTRPREKRPGQSGADAWSRRSGASNLEVHFDRLATVGGNSAERPTKIWEGANGGILWLAGLPTKDTASSFPRCDIQLNWMQQAVAARGGVALPGALHLQISITDSTSRDDQWREAWPVIRQTLFTGGSVLGHCMAGRHRAATGQSLLLALVDNISFEEAQRCVSRLRDVEIYKAMAQGTVAKWVRYTRKNSMSGKVWPSPRAFIFTDRSQIHLEVEQGVPLCKHRQGSIASQRLKDVTEVESVEEAQGYDRPFCKDCLQRAAAKFHPK